LIVIVGCWPGPGAHSACGEHLAGPTEDHHAHPVVGLGFQKGVVELDEHSPVLGVASLGPVQHDANDRAIVELFIRHKTSL
jgi:hypothetical protein